MKKLTLCLAVFASMAVQANTDLKSTGYIDIERIKRENPVPQVNIEEQRKTTEALMNKFQKADNQKIPESTIKRIELGNVGVKSQTVPEAINIKNLKNQVGTLDIEQMAKKYNESLNKKERKGENPAEQLTTGKAHLFISSSIPKATLEAMMNDAGRLGVTVFINGNMGDDPLKFAGTKKFLDTLKITTPPEIFIHPDAFEMFKIDQVPALVVSSTTVNNNLDEQGCAAPEDFDIIRGDLSVSSNLVRIFENATSPDIKDVARQYMKKINVTNN